MSNSEQWLRNYAEELGVTYSELIEKARVYQETGEYWNEGPLFEGVWIREGFWDHFQAVTGVPLVDGEDESFFTCSC